MVAKKQTPRKRAARTRRGPQRITRQVMTSTATQEQKLLRLIQDPCEAEMVTGYALTSTGLVQRFTKFITPAAATENAFAYVWNPTSQLSNGIYQKLATGGGAAANTQAPGPGEVFFENNAEAVAALAACIEVLYTGTLVNRKGYIGVCQASHNVMEAIMTGTTDLPTLLTYCQAVVPVPSHKVDIKWSPSMRHFTANGGTTEATSGNDNSLMVVAIGVNPNDFVVRFTGVYEYIPKFTLGAPAARVTKVYPVGVGERIISALDRSGTWWHNLGQAAGSALRMGYRAAYGIGQVAQLVSNSTALQAGRSAMRYLEPATALLALTG